MKLQFPEHYDRKIEFPITESLLIRLVENVGLLPAGHVYEIPRFEAERLILRRKATAVGKLGTMPDLTLTEAEFAEVGA